jgi:hypothetical protein
MTIAQMNASKAIRLCVVAFEVRLLTMELAPSWECRSAFKYTWHVLDELVNCFNAQGTATTSRIFFECHPHLSCVTRLFQSTTSGSSGQK